MRKTQQKMLMPNKNWILHQLKMDWVQPEQWVEMICVVFYIDGTDVTDDKKKHNDQYRVYDVRH